MKRTALLIALLSALLLTACSGAQEEIEEGISGPPPLSSSTLCGDAGKRVPCKVQLVELKVVPLSAATSRPPKEVKKLTAAGADILKAVIQISNQSRKTLSYRSDWYLSAPPDERKKGESLVPQGVSRNSKLYNKDLVPAWLLNDNVSRKKKRVNLLGAGTITETIYFYPARSDFDRVTVASSWFKPGFTANITLLSEEKRARNASASGDAAAEAAAKSAPIPQVRITARTTPGRAENGSEVNLIIQVNNVGNLRVKDLVLRFLEPQNAFALIGAAPTGDENDREESVKYVEPKPKRISSYGANYHFGELPPYQNKTIKITVARWVASVTQMQEPRPAGNVILAMDKQTILKAASVRVTLTPEKF